MSDSISIARGDTLTFSRVFVRLIADRVVMPLLCMAGGEFALTAFQDCIASKIDPDELCPDFTARVSVKAIESLSSRGLVGTCSFADEIWEV